MENNSASTTSQSFPTPWSPDAFPFWPSFFIAAGLLVLFFVVLLIANIFFVIQHCPFDPSTIALCSQRALFSRAGIAFQIGLQDVAELAAVGGLLAALPWLAKASLARLGFRPLDWRAVGMGLLGAVAMIVFVNGLGTLLQAVTKTHEQQLALKLIQQLNTPSGKLLAFVTAAVIAPFCEEVAFRVFIFNFVLRRASFWVAAILSGLLFGLAHITERPSAASLSTIVPLMVGGVILARVYYQSRNAFASMITHSVFNSLTLLLTFFAPNLVK